MEIRVSVADPARVGACVDVAVRAEPGTPLSAVRGPLLAAVGTDPVRCPPLHCDGIALDPAAPIGVRPLLDGALLTVGPAGIAAGAAAGTANAALELHVVGGPDAGAALPLPAGSWQLGRSAGAALRLDDPDVSRRHAELEVGTGVHLRDLGSTNGTMLAGRAVPLSEPVEVHPGEPIVVGGSTLVLRGPSGVPACCVPDGEGHEQVNRAPRMGPAPTPVQLHYPAPPPRRARLRVPWPAIVLPMLVAVPMALFWRQPVLLLLGLLSPLMVAAQVALDRRHGRRDDAAAGSGHATSTARADAELARAMADDLAARERLHPDLATLGRIAAGPTDRLWERRLDDADALLLRVGRGRVPSAVQVHRPADPSAGHVAGPAVGVPAEHPDAPITVDLRAVGVLGVCGPREPVLAAVRGLIAQAVVLHSPLEVRLVLLAAGEPEWSWLNWIPHRSGAEVLRSLPHEAAGPHLLVVVDGTARLRQSRLAELLVAGSDRVSVICVDSDPAALPVQCSATLALGRDGTGVLRRRSAAEQPLLPEAASGGWAHRLARDLAPLRDGAPADVGLVTSVRLPPLLARQHGVNALDADDIRRLWSVRPASPLAVLGLSEHGPHAVDLDADGPHLLVAGTTGAGKSELLQCLVTSLAVANAPEELAFVLVDYKGGAAFAECARLPHVTGLVTDLDTHLTRRALTSLAAELRRREALLRRAGVPDHAAYTDRRGDRAGPALPRLLLVVDEFRVLAEELPEFVTGLVRIAAVGRSLGVHLVLATQRPAGVVSAEIRANVNLRIALRVRDREDSVDVVDSATAARLPAGIPGRAVLRAGAGPLVHVQTAHVTATHAPPAAPAVHLLDASGAPADAPADAGVAPGSGSPGGSSDLALLVDSVRTAAGRAGRVPAPAPWLPPLPDLLLLADLREDAAPTSCDSTFGSTVPGPGSPPDLQVPFGLADHPGQQRQAPIGWRLDTGSHCAIVGGPRSGRTATLRTIAASAAARFAPSRLHLHVIGGSDELAALQQLPHAGTVVSTRDSRRVERLLALVLDEIAARQGNAEPEAAPLILLLVDSWEALADAAGHLQPRAADDLLRVLRDGAAAGVRVAISGGRGLLTGQVGGLLGERIVLRMNDPVDAALAGVPATSLPDRMPPGRAVRLGGDDPAGTEVQIATLAADPAASSQDAAVAALAGALAITQPPAGAGGSGAWRIRPLPPRVDRHQLRPTGGRRRIPVGVGGDEAATLSLDLQSCPGQLVLGAGGTGRSTALTTLGLGLLEAGAPVLVIAGPRSPAAGLAGLGAQLLDPLTAVSPAAGGPAYDVLVDDAGLLPPALEDWLLRRAVEATAGSGGSVTAVAQSAQAATAYRGILSQLRRHRNGLLLGAAGHGDGEAFSIRLSGPVGQAGAGGPEPPGRGLLVTSGHPVAIQVADPALPPPSSRTLDQAGRRLLVGRAVG